jgi:4-hydroxybenzoate polyprenyltransferase
MFVAVFAESIAWWTRRDSWLQTVRFLVILAALGAVVAAGLGWINASFTSYVGQSAAILKWHRWLGTGTALWAVVCAALVVMSKCEEGSRDRQRLRGALLLGAALVGISGFLGSALIYGLDHYSWN